MKCFSLFLAAVAPHGSLALVGSGWSFSGSPSGGLKDVTFPFNMAGTNHTYGYYYAQQFHFENIERVGYCGVQNRDDKDGKSVVHGVFSSFQDGAKSDDPNCSDGADGGPGVSCSVDFEGPYDVTYNITVENESGTKWKGTAINTDTGEEFHIGSYTPPSEAGGIENGQVGFVEYYPWNVGEAMCGKLPKTSVTMFYPTSNTPHAGKGSVNEPYQYGDCKGEVDFSTSSVEDGWKIEVGF